MSEDDAVDLLLELFGWDSADPHYRFEALRVLRSKRDEPAPNYDDYMAGRHRC